MTQQLPQTQMTMKTQKALDQQMQSQASIAPTLKTLKLSSEEQHFTQQYRSLEDLEREKGIKFF